jgi:type IV secretory pathway component VirB8
LRESGVFCVAHVLIVDGARAWASAIGSKTIESWAGFGIGLEGGSREFFIRSEEASQTMFFKKKSDPQQSAAAAIAAFEAETPDVGLAEARKQYMDSTGQPHISASRSFVAALVLGGIAVVEGLCIKAMIPLKTVVPYVITVNEATTEVRTDRAAVTPAAQYNPSVALLDRELFDFVKNMYAMNADAIPIITQQQGRAYAYTRGKATSEFTQFIQSDQVYQRMAKTPGLVRTVEKKTISHRDDASVVLIRFSATERSKASPDGITRNFVMQMTYTRAQPSKQSEIDSNPLGIYITNFDIQEEN